MHMSSAECLRRFIGRALPGLILATCILGGAPALADEFRGFWVDAWGAGFRSASEVETLLGQVGNASSRGRIRDANCNAVVVQVRRRADVCYPSGVGEPYMSGLSPSSYNALQAMINAAHDTTGGKKRIEVHAWIVAFATGSGSAPPAGSIYYDHNNPADPDSYWMTLDNGGSETDDKAFDPGHPKCLEYLTNVCLDLVTNFDIDGLHYDYIRFTGGNQGYNPTSIARYNARYGLTGQPAAGNEQFKQWRRDQVSALVRRVYAHTQAVKPQVKISAALVTWNPSPTSSTRSAFMNTRPYYDVYCDWDAWMSEGILDMSMPMTYYNQASLPNDFARWINFQKDRKFNRHNVVGPGIYLNSLSNAVGQLQATRNPSANNGGLADGFCGYSYRVPYSGGTWTGFSPSLVAQVTPTWQDVPDMSWKTAPTRGHMMGTATYAAGGAWADGAQVSITGPESRSMRCDGTGFYAFIDLTPGSYTLTASQAGHPNVVHNVTVSAGNMSQRNVTFGAVTSPPTIANVQITGITYNSATVTWDTDVPATTQLNYGTTVAYGQQTPLVATETTAHTVPLTGLNPGTTYYVEALSGNGFGADASGPHSFTTPAFSGEIVIDNTDPGWANTSPSGTWSSGSIADVPKVGGNYLFTAGVTATAENQATRMCTWTPDIPVAGRYDVYAFYQIGSNRSPAAPYKVVHDEGETLSMQNQYSVTPNQGGWFLLAAAAPFQPGTAGYVQLSNNTGDTSYVSADATRFVYVSPINVIDADFDADGDVDGNDLTHFMLCATGADVSIDQPGCDDIDLDNDGDGDQEDFGRFQRCLSGENVAADPGCED